MASSVRAASKFGSSPQDRVVVAVALDGQHVAGGQPGEPGADGLVVDALAQQHRALPGVDALGRHELDGGQVGQALVGDETHRIGGAWRGAVGAGVGAGAGGCGGGRAAPGSRSVGP